MYWFKQTYQAQIIVLLEYTKVNVYNLINSNTIIPALVFLDKKSTEFFIFSKLAKKLKLKTLSNKILQIAIFNKKN